MSLLSYTLLGFITGCAVLLSKKFTMNFRSKGCVAPAMLATIFMLLTSAGAWAQSPKPICDVGCGGSTANSSTMLTARTALTAARGMGSFTRPVSHPGHGSGTTHYPSPVLSKTIAVQGSQSYTYSVPLLSFPGRHGLNLGLKLHYNSFIWTPVGNAITLNADHGESTIITAPTAAAINAVESSSAGPAGMLAIPFATAIDAGARDFCSFLPDATLSFSPPPLP